MRIWLCICDYVCVCVNFELLCDLVISQVTKAFKGNLSCRLLTILVNLTHNNNCLHKSFRYTLQTSFGKCSYWVIFMNFVLYRCHNYDFKNLVISPNPASLCCCIFLFFLLCRFCSWVTFSWHITHKVRRLSREQSPPPSETGIMWSACQNWKEKWHSFMLISELQ